jgi:hypothetical protein
MARIAGVDTSLNVVTVLRGAPTIQTGVMGHAPHRLHLVTVTDLYLPNLCVLIQVLVSLSISNIELLFEGMVFDSHLTVAGR